MANYRPVDVRVWNDRKFLACGDEARLLWLFLLTCPSLPIPGVVVGGDASLSEQLGWTPERLRERFAELARNGLQVRRENRIVWLPNALKYQPPANPNMIKGWAKKWDDVPEGDLKRELWQALRIACKSWSVLFSKLFEEPSQVGCGNGSSNRSGNGFTHEHKHKHEHEHQHDHDPEKNLSPAGARAIPPVPVGHGPEHATPPDTGDRDPKPANAILSAYDHEDPRARGRLAESTYRQVSDALRAVAAELGLPAPLPFPPIGPSTSAGSFRDLQDRVREEGANAPAVCERVVANLIAQARADRSVEWLAEKSFGERPWRTARAWTPGKTARAGPTSSPTVGRVEPPPASAFRRGVQKI